MKVTEDQIAVLKAAVGKTFRLKAAVGSAADRRFKVTDLVPLIDFGGKRGKEPAFNVERMDTSAHHTPPALQFLEEYEEVTELAEA